MSQPLGEAGTPPGFVGQTKTMFYVEGSPAAVLVTRTRKGYRERPMTFATAELALAWCRRHMAALVYSPVNLQRN